MEATRRAPYLVVEVEGVAEEGRVVQEVKAGPVLRHAGLEQELLAHLHGAARLEQLGVPQAVHHDDQVVVELPVRLPADVEGLLYAWR